MNRKNILLTSFLMLLLSFSIWYLLYQRNKINQLEQKILSSVANDNKEVLKNKEWNRDSSANMYNNRERFFDNIQWIEDNLRGFTNTFRFENFNQDLNALEWSSLSSKNFSRSYSINWVTLKYNINTKQDLVYWEFESNNSSLKKHINLELSKLWIKTDNSNDKYSFKARKNQLKTITKILDESISKNLKQNIKKQIEHQNPDSIRDWVFF